MKKKIIYEDMLAFCGNDYSLRPMFTEPRYAEGFWNATDGKALIHIDENHVKKDSRLKKEYTEGRLPNYKSVISGKKFDRILNLAALESALGKLDKIDEIDTRERDAQYEECPICSGTGEMQDEVRFRDYYVSYQCDCPVCQGFGKVPKDEDYDPSMDDAACYVSVEEYNTGRKVFEKYAAVCIDNIYFNANQLEKIRLFLEKINLADVRCGVYDSKIEFDLGFGIILLMGCVYKEGKTDAIVTTKTV